MRAGGPGPHGVQEHERIENTELVAADERCGAAGECGGAVEVVGHGDTDAEHIELGGEVLEDEFNTCLGVRVALRDVRLDAGQVPGRRGCAPDLALGSSVCGVLGAHEGGGRAAGRGEEEAGLLTGDERADCLAEVIVGEESQDRGHGLGVWC